MAGKDLNERSAFYNIKMMGKRLGVYDHAYPNSNPLYLEHKPPGNIGNFILDNEVGEGIDCGAMQLRVRGGLFQQERMILDKRRGLDRALYYSYQGANILKVPQKLEDFSGVSLEKEKIQHPVRALINPDKLKYDYDDKILSVPFEDGFQVGDVFEWIGTDSYWLITLQDIEELAYFRADIRRCSYEVTWDDEDGRHTSYVAVRGPVETKINYIQKHQISIDTPNHSLHIYMPRTESALKYFRRYSKFYLQGEDEGSPKICWRVEATDWISTPGILEITAVEYYANESEDDIEAGLVGTLITKPEEPEGSIKIIGESFIKPKTAYIYRFSGMNLAQWNIDTKKYPIRYSINPNNPLEVKVIWDKACSGQFEISFGEHTKTVVVESLF